MFHEKNVNHRKTDGSIRVIPAAIDFIPSSTSSFGISFRYKLYNGTKSTFEARAGFAHPGSYSLYNNTHYYCTEGSPYSFVVWSVSFKSSGELSSINHYKVNVVSVTEQKVTFDYTLRMLSWGYVTGDDRLDWGVNYNLDRVLSVFDRHYPKSNYAYTWRNQSANSMFAQNTMAISPSSIRTLISRTSRLLEETNVSHQDVHFGDLAMQAVKKVNANEVNMFAFLKDLRRPWEMIPKLRNLAKLKTHADNYLSVNYGVLPTVNDLQTIMQAFKRIGPYIDSNGFSTYNAFHGDNVQIGTMNSRLEQRIKVAISDDESALSQLYARIASAGFDLTLKNVWDLIPYSFVIDWFVDVGSFLERTDTRLRLQRRDIKYATMSQKHLIGQTFRPGPTQPFAGTIEVVRYSRWTSDQCPVPPLSAKSTITAHEHWLESTALLVQRNSK